MNNTVNAAESFQTSSDFLITVTTKFWINPIDLVGKQCFLEVFSNYLLSESANLV